jgi:predicted acyl esterase
VDFYSDYGVSLQKKFFGHFLKGEQTGWDAQPPVLLNVRHVDGTLSLRGESEWPIARTEWTRLFIGADDMSLREAPPVEAKQIEYDPLGPGVTFMTPQFEADTEVTGPIAAKLWIRPTSTDADLFLIVGLFDADGNEVTFMGALDPNTPLAQGWLRASHRKLDPERSLPYRPFHAHDEVQPLIPGEVYELEIEIWPTCVVVLAGYRLGLTVKGADYRFEGDLPPFAEEFHYARRGIGPFEHNDPHDRPADVFGAPVTLLSGGSHASSVLLPFVPPAD